MADLYVLAVDRPPLANAAANTRRLRAGDVVEILEDGEGPGTAVENSGMYKVVRVPGTRADWAYLMANTPFDPNNVQPKRVKTLDIVSIYAVAQKDKISHPKMGECINATPEFVKGIESATPAIESEVVL